MENLTFDLGDAPVRALNHYLHSPADALQGKQVLVTNPDGALGTTFACAFTLWTSL